MKFVDYVTITVRSGKGGPGAVAFRREKYEPKGGSAGGDGGEGGSVVIEADANLYTLLDLRYNRHHFAKNGDPGSGNNKKAKDAPDIVLRVPPGTVVLDTDTEEVIGEVLEAGDSLVLVQGGRGGRATRSSSRPRTRRPAMHSPENQGRSGTSRSN
jgi:GTPase